MCVHCLVQCWLLYSSSSVAVVYSSRQHLYSRKMRGKNDAGEESKAGKNSLSLSLQFSLLFALASFSYISFWKVKKLVKTCGHIQTLFSRSAVKDVNRIGKTVSQQQQKSWEKDESFLSTFSFQTQWIQAKRKRKVDSGGNDDDYIHLCGALHFLGGFQTHFKQRDSVFKRKKEESSRTAVEFFNFPQTPDEKQSKEIIYRRIF